MGGSDRDEIAERIREAAARRQQLLVGQEHIVAEVARLLFADDHIGLDFGHNTDEYVAEAETIVLRLPTAYSQDEVPRIVHEEFVRWFDRGHRWPRGSVSRCCWANLGVMARLRHLRGKLRPRVAIRPRQDSAERLRGLLLRWQRWVEELEDHPLDAFEYEGALEARDSLAEALTLVDDEKLWDLTDELDSRFQAMTVEVTTSPFIGEGREGWWWQRLPASDEYRSYLAGDY